LKLADYKPIQVKPAAREVVACTFYYDKLCFRRGHIDGSAHVFDWAELIPSAVHKERGNSQIG
jgi:hypothetical protein